MAVWVRRDRFPRLHEHGPGRLGKTNNEMIMWNIQSILLVINFRAIPASSKLEKLIVDCMQVILVFVRLSRLTRDNENDSATDYRSSMDTNHIIQHLFIITESH